MNCGCHDLPMYWQKGKSCRAGGYWRCVVQRRERQLRYWHKKNGGYVTRRRRQLGEQRSRIEERLVQLREDVDAES